MNFRLVLICTLAASVSLPIGLVSLAKFVLFICTIIILLCKPKLFPSAESVEIRKQITNALIFVSLGAFATSMSWSTGTVVEATNSLSKYGKLLIIPIFCVLIKSRREALFVLASFSFSQLFLVVSTWMLLLKMPVPWALSPSSLSHNVVFSSYLDEGLMSAVFAAVTWHLRTLVPGNYGRYFASAAVVLALGDVFFLLEGRTAHVVALLLLTYAIFWKLPFKLRFTVFLLPIFIASILYVTSPKVQVRLDRLTSEVQEFSFKQGADADSESSSGIRLHLWHRAVQSISENAAFGSGVGSWKNEFSRLERMNSMGTSVQSLRNPHQEYLLWGVQLGVPGVMLLLALMISIFRDSLAMETQIKKAIQSSLLALSVACLFNSSLYDAQIGDFFCVILGLLLALGLNPRDSTLAAKQIESNNTPA